MVNAKLIFTLAMASSGAVAASIPQTETSPALKECEKRDNACRTAPSANMAVCSLEKSNCQTAAKGECDKAFNSCRTGPNANMAVCASEKAQCESLGHELSSGSSSSTPIVGTPIASTATPSVGPTRPTPLACVAQQCRDKDSACRTAPGANMAVCSSEAAECEQAANRQCEQGFNSCRTSPDANMAVCAAQKAQCGSLSQSLYACAASTASPTPTPTPSGSVSCEKQDEACRTAPGANMAVCSAQRASCDASCETQYNACRSAPGANMAVCAARKANCDEKQGGSASATPSSTSSPPVATPLFTGAASRVVGMSSSVLGLFAIALGFF